MNEMQRALYEVLTEMDYEHLITYAEQVWGIVGPDGYKHEDLILLIVNGV